ncbi:MurR/RpiR family transcriptional regulator [Microbacterium arborescens]|uniref:MurR/RpiR family transcriptional regulator n=1 Tax=Microbacterium arborescens TaxID=33883 RepID=UPI00277F094E|nr:MurR/RpiR family transcriptional regulator [Microbacterium arborescens]MDQ1216960.1 RpiR family carbohydrate utilization transcriptional regulator [Microbacterium arborescens]
MSGNAPPTVRIRALRNGLQPTERRVADVILDAPEDVVELTAQQLADRAGVARSSVVRACQTFGFRGYPQLRVALAAELGGAAPAASDHGDGALGRVRRSIDRAAAALPASTSLLDADEVERAVTAVVGAGRLLVVANGLSSPVASDLAMRLTAAGRPAEVIADVIAQQISARQLTARDVCVVVSGSGANEASLRAAAAAASGGAVVIAITSFAASPLVECATHALVIAPAGTSFRDELEHTSRAAHALFVEAFADEAAARLPGGASAVRAQVLEILSDNLGA